MQVEVHGLRMLLRFTYYCYSLGWSYQGLLIMLREGGMAMTCESRAKESLHGEAPREDSDHDDI